MTHATTTQTVLIAKMLDQYLNHIGDDCVEFKEGWDDQKIATEVSTPESPLNKSHVARIRKELHGTFIRASKGSKTGELEMKIGMLEDKLAHLADLHHKLCLKLSLDRVSDVRYLAGEKQ